MAEKDINLYAETRGDRSDVGATKMKTELVKVDFHFQRSRARQKRRSTVPIM